MKVNPSDLVKSSVKLSSPPEIFVKLNETMEDPDFSFSDISRIIGSDPSLSARLLKIVNSSFYSFPSTIESIPHAVSIIGSRQLRDLALSTTILTSFEGIPETLIDIGSFWSHSIACGIAARTIALHSRETNTERYFLAGVLHDIGRLVILENFPELAREILNQTQASGELLFKTEENILGFDHAILGAALIESWQLPSYLEETIRCHHHPLKSTNYPVESSILNLSDAFAKSMELGNSGDPFLTPLDPISWNRIGISTTLLSVIWNQIETQYEETAKFFFEG